MSDRSPPQSSGEPARSRWALRATTKARLAGFLVPCAALALWVVGRRLQEESSPLFVVLVVGVAAIGVAATLFVLLVRRVPGRDFLTGATADRRLGLPYKLQLGTGALAGWWTLVVTHEAMELSPLESGFPWRPAAPKRVPLADVGLVVARPTFVEIVCEREGGRTVLAIRNAAYVDRGRLLWELAVRVPDAVERGIDEPGAMHDVGAPPAPGFVEPTARPGSVLPPTGPRRSSSPVPLPDASTSVDAIGAGMDHIGSALAGPVEERRPAPPKSGLGCGLFVATPRGDADEDD